MVSRFSRTLRSVQADGFGVTVPLLVVAVALTIAWGCWLVIAQVPVHVVSLSSRVELEQAVWAVETTVGGTLAQSRLELGSAVERGDELAQLDRSLEEFELQARRAQLASTQGQIDALEAELVAHEQALTDAGLSSSSALVEAASRVQDATLVAALARKEYEITAKLKPEGYVSELSAFRAETQMQQADMSRASLPATLERERNERAALSSGRRATLARLRREKQVLLGVRQVALTEIEELERNLDRRTLRAPASGTVAEVSPIAMRSYLGPGTRLATIVAPTDLHVVAEFPAASALGRLKVGQRATMRLEGFSWSQYGELELEVVRAASEAKAGSIRVELRLIGEPPPGIQLQHGLAGDCYVQVEQASPVDLLLRAAGGGQRAADTKLQSTDR